LAVTQQLARISTEFRIQCATESEAFRKLIEFGLEPFDVYLDLNWSPNELIEIVSFYLGEEISGKFDSLFSDDKELLNKNNSEGIPEDCVYSKVTVANLELVCEINAALKRLTRSQVEKYVHNKFVSGGYKDWRDPVNYLAEVYNQLTCFLAEACRLRQVIVAWWD
jgi:hypothetical protein